MTRGGGGVDLDEGVERREEDECGRVCKADVGRWGVGFNRRDWRYIYAFVDGLCPQHKLVDEMMHSDPPYDLCKAGAPEPR